MSEMKISELSEAESVNDEDLIMVVQEGTNKQVPAKKILKTLAIGPAEPTNGADVWIKKSNNLLYTPYTVDNPLTITAETNNHEVLTDYYAYIEAGKYYTISFETDGKVGSSKTEDTVDYSLNINRTGSGFVIITNPRTFKVDTAGYYYLAVQVNKAGCTRSFWNFQIEEGSEATPYEEYVDREIYCKKNNGTYEKFITTPNKSELVLYENEEGTGGDITFNLYKGDVKWLDIYFSVQDVNYIRRVPATGLIVLDGMFFLSVTQSFNFSIMYQVNNNNMTLIERTGSFNRNYESGAISGAVNLEMIDFKITKIIAY